MNTTNNSSIPYQNDILNMNQFWETCSQSLNKQKIEEYAKLLNGNEDLLRKFKENLLQELENNGGRISASLAMNILFIANKSIGEIQSDLASDVWLKVVEKSMQIVLNSVDELKELQRALKLIKIWMSSQKLPKDFLIQWKVLFDDACARKEMEEKHQPPMTPPVNAQKEHKRKRPRSDSDKHYNDSQETSTSPSSIQQFIDQFKSGTATATPSDSIVPADHTSSSSKRDRIRGENNQSIRNISEMNEIVLQMFHSMCKFIKHIFDHFISLSQSNNEILHWKMIQSTSFWFLHNYIETMAISDDNISLSLACIYLSGKIEQFFIKTEKLRNIAQKFLYDCFGRDSHLPNDHLIFKYELRLLHVICFDANAVQNPVKKIKQWIDEKRLESSTFHRVVAFFQSEGVLYQHRYWSFSAESFVMFAMIITEARYNNPDFLRETIKRIIKHPLFEEVKSNLSELVELFQISQHYEMDLIKDKKLFYSTLKALFEKSFRTRINLLPAYQVNSPVPPPSTSSIEGKASDLANPVIGIAVSEEPLLDPTIGASVTEPSNPSFSPTTEEQLQPPSTPPPPAIPSISPIISRPLDPASVALDRPATTSPATSHATNTSPELAPPSLAKQIQEQPQSNPDTNLHSPNFSRKTTMNSLAEKLKQHSIDEEVPPPPPPLEEFSQGDGAMEVMSVISHDPSLKTQESQSQGHPIIREHSMEMSVSSRQDSLQHLSEPAKTTELPSTPPPPPPASPPSEKSSKEQTKAIDKEELNQLYAMQRKIAGNNRTPTNSDNAKFQNLFHSGFLRKQSSQEKSVLTKRNSKGDEVSSSDPNSQVQNDKTMSADPARKKIRID